ncbi:ClbS/DfsB family four-helix bundle protein [Janthinobacterium sp. B9-8]|uniref:ClbS/DfsB family four-helix bundle protein n=1 Tax=Janthinobacterium sp. B9-8 TaxID=1236179 RepID=UPI00061CF7F0|nr:ClbS/DfsB family four-helix bundle protein [Janthinobacterium sp. B9-8]AMC34857.1 hypothetical protein VN23_09660 [Janthinobacterium sp. B9-8]
MPLPCNKAELLLNFDSAYSKLIKELATIPEQDTRLPEIEGKISACDLLAYQIGWGRLLLQWDKDELQGKPAQMPAPGFKWNQLGLLAQSFYTRHCNSSLSQLHAEFAELAGQIRQFILDNEESTLFEQDKRKWAGDKWPIVKWIQVNTIAPYQSACSKLRRWKKHQSLPAAERPSDSASAKP